MLNRPIPAFIYMLFLSSTFVTGQSIPEFFDLNEYRRVNFDRRVTTLRPNSQFRTFDNLNVPNSGATLYNILDFSYSNSLIHNSVESQSSSTTSFDFRVQGDESFIDMDELNVEFTKGRLSRNYGDDGSYELLGYNVSTGVNRRRQDFINSEKLFAELEVGGSIGFGWGRLEYINDAFIIIRIFEELEKNDLLNSPPSNELILMLSDIHGELRTDRVFDNRLKNLYVRENLIRSFIENGVIDESSVMAILIIDDTLQFENRSSIQLGRRLEFRMSPSLAIDRQLEKGGLPDIELPLIVLPTFYGVVEYIDNNSIESNLFMSHTLRGSLYFAREFNLFDNKTNVDEETGVIDFSYDMSYEYIPSIRTNLTWTISGVVRLRSSNNINDGQSPTYESSFLPNSSLEYRYYLSPQTQFSIFGNVWYTDNQFQIGDWQPRLSASLRLGMIHQIQ